MMKNNMDDLIVVNDFGWYWPKDDGNGKLYESGSCWYGLSVLAPDVPKQISEHVPEKKVVVQAGGNCGYYVKQYSELFDLVYTFEPDPLNFLCLTMNCRSPNVVKFQACLGFERQKLSVGRWLGDVGSCHVTGSGAIPTMRIDDLSLDRCDLIQLDVEGYELNALKGAVETIKKCKPVIAVEVYEDWARRYNTSTAEVDVFLNDLGYKTDVTLENGDKIYKFVE
jgi:FkbM family methyltransferase